MISLKGLQRAATAAEWQAGLRMAAKGQLREVRVSPGLAEFSLSEPPYALVRLQAEGQSHCDCGQPHCRHLVAAMVGAEKSGTLRQLQAHSQQAASQAFAQAVESLLPEAPSLQVEPSLFIEDGKLSISLRAGEDRLYVVRHLPRFLQALDQQQPYELSNGLMLELSLRAFSPQEAAFLQVLVDYCQAVEFGEKHLSPQQVRRMPLTEQTGLRAMRALSGLRFRLTQGGSTRIQQGIATATLPVVFYVSPHRGGLAIRARLDASCTLAGADGSFMVLDGQLVRVKREDMALTRALLSREERLFTFPRMDLDTVTRELLPTLMHSRAVVLDPRLEARMIRLPLKAEIYLDQAGGDVVARIRFHYGDVALDPFSPDSQSPRLLLHDAIGERRVLEALADAGFRVRKGYVYLRGEEAIYHFLTEGVQELGRQAQLFLSNDFKRLTPRAASLSGRLTAGAGGLKLEMLDDGTPIEELAPILQAIRSGKKYFRYKDGSFITLRGIEDWQQLAEAALEAVQAQNDLRDLPAYRAYYLQALIDHSALPVQVDEDARALTKLPDAPPPSPVKGLHPYQERGFQWLVSLHQLRMGGILADDMGLGKTVQTIAAILHSVQTEPQRMPSIIVMPTSLGYNWLKEFARFAPSLKVQLLTGPRAKRQQMIEEFAAQDAPDVMLISYPLVRQDIDLLREIPFRYAVLDEAQFIKNSLSLSARAVKRLQAQTRLALSGTPMENNVAELWSLFDFVLPGYLPGIRDFLRRYDQGRNADDLLRRIRPFLMRRLKQEVMAELPEKIESVISVPMPSDQRRVYQAVLAQKRLRLEGLLEHNALSGARGEVLSALMELRQICCHPALVLPGYTGEAGKFELLRDILPDALEGGHRVLIFSQFTSLLKLLRQQLQQEGIQTLYLDGDTKPEERQQLADRFNAGNEPVFLISLKAGGTGLNLTGADMVIHYDPWWNPAAEDQAADRAHRLGQEKTVQVLRLVMHDSIEEQVLELGRGKRRLFEQLITPGESLPHKMSQQDVLALFGVKQENK